MLNIVPVLNVFFIFIVLAAAGLGFLVGYKRKTKRSLVSLICMAAALFLSFLLTKFAILPALRKILPETVSGMLDKEYIPLTAESAGGVLLYIMAAGLIGLIVFLLLFGILRLLLLIPDCIVRHSIKKKETEEYRKDSRHKIIGGVAGVLGGLMLALPFLGVFAMPFGLGRDLAEIVDKTQIVFSEENALPADLKGASVPNFFYDIFSLPLMNSFSSVKYEEESESLSVLTNCVRTQADVFGKAYNVLSKEGEKTSDDILLLLDCVDSSAAFWTENALLRNLFADFLANLTNLTDAELPVPQETLDKLVASLRANDGSFGKLLGSVRNAAAIAVQLSAGEVNSSTIAESITWLSENLDKETAETVKEAAAGALSDIASGKTGEILNNAFANLCDRLASGEKMTEAQSAKNAAALTKFYDIGTKVAGEDLNGKDVFGDILPSADELIADIAEAELISEVVKDLAFDAQGQPVENPLGENITLSQADSQKFTEALASYRSAHPAADEKTLEAISRIFGLI